jgi:membrane associated rhomboid family serine protease
MLMTANAHYNLKRRMLTADQGTHVLNAHQRARAQRKELTALLRQRTPHAIATWALAGVNVAIYVAMAIDGGRAASFPTRLLVAWGALVSNGEWWRLFTATFLHVNALHLASNMIALSIVGPVVERLVGTRAFVVFYVAAGLVGSAVGRWSHVLVVSAGASGSIIGLYGVLLAMMFDRRESTASLVTSDTPPVSRPHLQVHLPQVVSLVAATLLIGWFDPRADNAAHIGGFVAGFLFGWTGGRHIESRLPSPAVPAAAIVVALACCAVSLAAQPRVTDIRAAAFFGVFQADSRALERYSRAAGRNADPATVARVIEEDIVPVFSRERAKLDSVRGVAKEQTPMLADLRQYLTLREAFWRKRAAMMGRMDGTSDHDVDAADRAADAVMRRLLEVR